MATAVLLRGEPAVDVGQQMRVAELKKHTSPAADTGAITAFGTV